MFLIYFLTLNNMGKSQNSKSGTSVKPEYEQVVYVCDSTGAGLGYAEIHLN
jgi:hypothetical protein